MANLKIGVPSVALASAVSVTSGTGIGSYPETNLFGGNRTDAAHLTSFGTDVRFNFAGPAPLAADFLFIGGYRRLLLGGLTALNVRAHTTNSYAGGADVSLTAAALVGPHGEDYLATFPPLSRQFWWVNTTNAGSPTAGRVLEKLFLGAAFDMGRDPDEDGGVRVRRLRPAGSQRRAAYTLDLAWGGVSYAKAVEFHRTFALARRHQPVVLFTTAYHEVLADARVLFGRLTEVSTPPVVTGVCEVTATFEELV